MLCDPFSVYQVPLRSKGVDTDKSSKSHDVGLQFSSLEVISNHAWPNDEYKLCLSPAEGPMRFLVLCLARKRRKAAF